MMEERTFSLTNTNSAYTSHTKGSTRWYALMQEFGADLFVADPGNLGGWALADALSIPKAIIQVPGFHPPVVRAHI